MAQNAILVKPAVSKMMTAAELRAFCDENRNKQKEKIDGACNLLYGVVFDLCYLAASRGEYGFPIFKETIRRNWPDDVDVGFDQNQDHVYNYVFKKIAEKFTEKGYQVDILNDTDNFIHHIEIDWSDTLTK